VRAKMLVKGLLPWQQIMTVTILELDLSKLGYGQARIWWEHIASQEDVLLASFN
jgi:hypothetical protein